MCVSVLWGIFVLSGVCLCGGFGVDYYGDLVVGLVAGVDVGTLLHPV